MEVCWVNFSDTKSSWAELHALNFSATSCSNIIEIFTTCFQMIHEQATTMLPRILYLVIAEPGISIERTFFILFIEAWNILPARVVGVVSHDTLVRQVIKVCRVNCFNQMALNIENISINQSYEICIANLENIVTSLIVLMDINTSSSHNSWNVIFADKSVACLKASSSSECMHNIVNT